MSYYLISIGGTGAKCLEAFVHMNAMGLITSPEAIHIICVDQDASNGNLSKAREAVGAYNNAYEVMAPQEKFFKNALVMAENTWSPVPPTANKILNLKSIFERSNMNTKERDLDCLFDALFSEEEQNTVLTEGFRAHPAIGAAVIGANMNMETEGSVWKAMVDEIAENKAKIFFLGSVFGGTGAAGFPNIAKIIRKYFDDKAANNNPDKAKDKKDERVKMGGCLMLPYFNFPKAEEKNMIDPDDPTKKIIVPDSGKFKASTYAALNYYDASNLVGDIFDVVYLLGDQLEMKIGKYRPGQKDQKNKAHYLEMLAALAACEFFNKPEKDDYFKNPKSYMLALEDEKLRWKDLPAVDASINVENKVRTFIRTIYMYRSMAFLKLKSCYADEGNFKDNPWIEPFFHEIRDAKKFGLFNTTKDQAYISKENYEKLETFNKYCITFMDWLKDFTFAESAEEVHNLRGSELVNPRIFAIDDSKTYDENLSDPSGERIVSEKEVFSLKVNTGREDGEGSFLQKLTRMKTEEKGLKPLLAMMYDQCGEIGKEVE